ncbi:hypothetical protein NA78x_006138 [Anatilimnocola sp. NA78]|uniref:hypothetical protein n=1 Tax=Anatilimnocola sp. NA78 TaxID=3415683 RepID=UPI003CE47B90
MLRRDANPTAFSPARSRQLRVEQLEPRTLMAAFVPADVGLLFPKNPYVSSGGSEPIYTSSPLHLRTVRGFEGDPNDGQLRLLEFGNATPDYYGLREATGSFHVQITYQGADGVAQLNAIGITTGNVVNGAQQTIEAWIHDNDFAAVKNLSGVVAINLDPGSVVDSRRDLIPGDGVEQHIPVTQPAGFVDYHFGDALSQIFAEYGDYVAAGGTEPFLPANPLVEVEDDRILLDLMAGDLPDIFADRLEAVPDAEIFTDEVNWYKVWVPFSSLDELGTLKDIIGYARPSYEGVDHVLSEFDHSEPESPYQPSVPSTEDPAEGYSASIVLEAVDTQGNPLATVTVGMEFWLRARLVVPVGKVPFSGALDIEFTPGMFAAVDDPENRGNFNYGTPGISDGLVDDVWRICWGTADGDLLFAQKFKAIAAGTTVFASNPPDGIAHEILYLGLEAPLEMSEVSFGSLELELIETALPPTAPPTDPDEIVVPDVPGDGTQPVPTIPTGGELIAAPVIEMPTTTPADENVTLADVVDSDEEDADPPVIVDNPLSLAAVAPKVGVGTTAVATAEENTIAEVRLVDVSALNLQRLQLLFRPVASGVLDFQVSGGAHRRSQVETPPPPQRDEKPATESAPVTR